jgi:hypothetical protein
LAAGGTSGGDGRRAVAVGSGGRGSGGSMVYWVIDKTHKRYSISMSGCASRRSSLRNVEGEEEEEKEEGLFVGRGAPAADERSLNKIILPETKSGARSSSLLMSESQRRELRESETSEILLSFNGQSHGTHLIMTLQQRTCPYTLPPPPPTRTHHHPGCRPAATTRL